MSKAHDPHWRYVALRLNGRPVGRRALQNALLGRARREGVPDEHAPQLTRLEWPHAIVRVHHHVLAAAREWLPRIDFAVEGDQKVPLAVATLSSSGTIKALTDRLGILHVRGDQKPARGAGPGGKAGDAPRGKPGDGLRGKPGDGPRGMPSKPARSAGPSRPAGASRRGSPAQPSGRTDASRSGALSSEPAAPPGAPRRGIAPARGPQEE